MPDKLERRKRHTLLYDNIPNQNADKMMGLLIISLAPIYFVATFYYGYRVLLTGLFATFICFVLDNICYSLRKSARNLKDYSSIITGLILNLLMPANIPFGILFCACFVSICIAKHPFGGFGKNSFNPAAVGFCFVSVCWPKEVLTYPTPFNPINIDGITQGKLVAGVSESLFLNSTPNISLNDILLGQFAGPIGVTSVFILLACSLFLIINKVINWKIPFVCILTCAAFAFIFPRAELPQWQAVVYEITSGLIVFGSIFMACDPVNLPKNGPSQILYAFFLGIGTMLFRYFGHFYFGFCFSLIIINALTSTLDIAAEHVLAFIGKAENKTKAFSHTIIRKSKEFKFLKSNGNIIKRTENQDSFNQNRKIKSFSRKIKNTNTEEKDNE